MVELAATIFSDGPSSNPNQPMKPLIRDWGTWLEQVILAFTSGAGGILKTSRAALFADLAHAADTTAWVLGDPTVAYNGIYVKAGASGTGSWTRVSDLPFSFIIASDVGAGTPNAIQATTSIPVSGSALVWSNVFEANTASPVTISFNGGSALTIKTNSGNDVAVGGLTAGMIVLGIVSGSTFRLLNDQVSSAIVDAAEAAQAAAEAAQAAAEDAAADAVALVGLAATALQPGAESTQIDYTDDRAGAASLPMFNVNRLRGAMPEYFPPSGVDGRTIGTPSTTAAQDNAAFQAAINTGDRVILGDGKKYKLTGISAKGAQTIEGSDSLGKGSEIVVSHATNDILVMEGTESDCEITRVTFNQSGSVTRTGGHIVRLGPIEGQPAAGNYHRLTDVAFFGVKDPIIINTSNRSDLADIKLYACSGALMTVVGGFNHIMRGLRTLNDPGAQPTYGLYIKEVGDLLISESQLLRAGNCMFLDVPNGKEIASVWIADTFLDSAVRGLWARSSGSGKIDRCKASDSWLGNHSQQGVLIQMQSTGQIDGIRFKNCEICLNGDAGISTSGNVKNIRDEDCLIAANVGAGVSWGAGASHMSSESFVGANSGLNGNGTGFVIDTTVTDSLIAPKELGSNTTNFNIGANALLPASNNVMRGAPGLRAVKRGSASVSAQTSVPVTHGLPFTPNDYDIKLTALSALTATKLWVSSVTSTQFTINLDASSTGFIGWEAKIPLSQG